MFNKIAVLGAGHGGHAIAADLSMVGYHVNVYELPEFYNDNLKPIIERGGIEVIARTPEGKEFELPAGGRSGFIKITGKITSDMRVALEGVDLILLVVPSFGRERFVKEMGPYIKDGQTIIIFPGFFGAIQCNKVLKDIGYRKDLNICETESLHYICKRIGPAKVLVKAKKDQMLFSVFPAKQTKKILKEIKKIYPQMISAKNVLETTLANNNSVVHPQSILLNMHMVERKLFPYHEIIGGGLCRNYGVTKGMARIMEGVDREKVMLGERLGLKIMKMKDAIKVYYGVEGKDLYEAIYNCFAYHTQLAPTSIKHRYVTEDVPYGLVPFASLGNQLEVPVPTIKAMATIGSVATGIDFWNDGMTMEKLGLANKSAKELNEYVENGS